MKTLKQVHEARLAVLRAEAEADRVRLINENCPYPQIGKVLKEGKPLFYAYLRGYSKAPTYARKWQILAKKLEIPA
jgi:hypothetical protein